MIIVHIPDSETIISETSVGIGMGFTTDKWPGYYPPRSTSLSNAPAPNAWRLSSLVLPMYAHQWLGILHWNTLCKTNLFGPSNGNIPANLQTMPALVDPEINKGIVINNKATMWLYSELGLDWQFNIQIMWWPIIKWLVSPGLMCS
jgi:hypothetical protein